MKRVGGFIGEIRRRARVEAFDFSGSRIFRVAIRADGTYCLEPRAADQ